MGSGCRTYAQYAATAFRQEKTPGGTGKSAAGHAVCFTPREDARQDQRAAGAVRQVTKHHWSLTLTKKGLQRAVLRAHKGRRRVLANAWEWEKGKFAWKLCNEAWARNGLVRPGDMAEGDYWLAETFETALKSIERWLADPSQIPPPDVKGPAPSAPSCD